VPCDNLLRNVNFDGRRDVVVLRCHQRSSSTTPTFPPMCPDRRRLRPFLRVARRRAPATYAFGDFDVPAGVGGFALDGKLFSPRPRLGPRDAELCASSSSTAAFRRGARDAADADNLDADLKNANHRDLEERSTVRSRRPCSNVTLQLHSSTTAANTRTSSSTTRSRSCRHLSTNPRRWPREVGGSRTSCLRASNRRHAAAVIIDDLLHRSQAEAVPPSCRAANSSNSRP